DDPLAKLADCHEGIRWQALLDTRFRATAVAPVGPEARGITLRRFNRRRRRPLDPPLRQDALSFDNAIEPIELTQPRPVARLAEEIRRTERRTSPVELQCHPLHAERSEQLAPGKALDRIGLAADVVLDDAGHN